MKIKNSIKLILIALMIVFIAQFLPYNKVEAASKPNIQVSYDYNSKKDVVTVNVKSNMKFKKTKPSWKLSKDKKTYSKKFYTNQTYKTTFTASNGKSQNIKIKVKQIKGPKLVISYKYYKSSNKVKVNVQSSKKYKNTKPTWTLSKGKKTYTKFFTANQTYKTIFYDEYGNAKTVKIKVNQIDKKGPQAKITYNYTTDKKSVVVKVVADEPMRKTLDKTVWKLSQDQKTYTGTFSKNAKFNIVLKDRYYNETKRTINITEIGKNTNENTNTKKIYKGIDVSTHNDKIDWDKVKKAGIDFAIIRCGFGKNSTKQDDDKFRYNIEECKRLSIPYGVYIYSYALKTEDAISEADHVLRLIKGYTPSYGIWFDMEDADGYKSRNGMPSNSELVNMCDTFCKQIKKSGYSKVGIYANLSWWNNQLNDSKLDVYDKWVAQWGKACTYGKKYIMWQYTSDGTVDGIIGRVDMNLFYTNK